MQPIVLAAGRGAGNTHALATWVKGGAPLDGFPYWTRVLVVPEENTGFTREQFDLDFDQVLSLAEFQRKSHFVPWDRVEFALDGVEHLLANALHLPKLPSVMAIWGQHELAQPFIREHTPEPVPELTDEEIIGRLIGPADSRG